VGDDWVRDIAPAASVGIPVYWIAEQSDKPPTDVSLVGQGTLTDLWKWIRTHVT
jgi:hypothetical protein